MHNASMISAYAKFSGWIIDRYSSDKNPASVFAQENYLAWPESFGLYQDFTELNALESALLPLAYSYVVPRTAIICC